jgi:murein L,D-transpeptidase YcbB/YkuD
VIVVRDRYRDLHPQHSSVGTEHENVGGIGNARLFMALARRQRERQAQRYNSAHPELAAEFARLTGVDPGSIRMVSEWQAAHGLTPDGKIGPQTIAAARSNDDKPAATAHSMCTGADDAFAATMSDAMMSMPTDAPASQSAAATAGPSALVSVTAPSTAADPSTTTLPERTHHASGDGSIRSALESIDVATRTEKVLAINPARIFELVPWNTQDKANAFRPVQAAIKKLRQAEAAVKSSANPKAKERALHRFEEATKQLEVASTKLKSYVLSQLPRIERNDAAMQRYRAQERDAHTKLLHARGDEKKAAEKQLADAQSHEQAREQELKTQIDEGEYGLTETERHIYVSDALTPFWSGDVGGGILAA